MSILVPHALPFRAVSMILACRMVGKRLKLLRYSVTELAGIAPSIDRAHQCGGRGHGPHPVPVVGGRQIAVLPTFPPSTPVVTEDSRSSG